MIILGIDSSATAASVAVVENNKLVSEIFSDTGLTHSQTLMPMIENCIKTAGIGVDDIDLIAVTNGPGSFTGVRIGIATVKGIAFTNDIPCAEISTLESLAYNVPFFDGIICSVMDARCNQVYSALFEAENDNKIKRLSEDTAISIDDLGNKLLEINKPVLFVGDGADICYDKLKNVLFNVSIAPPTLKKQRASSTAYCGASSEQKSSKNLAVNYIRLPQAQRELLKKRNS